MEVLLAIINSSFDKLSLIFGVLLIMVSIFCTKPIVILRTRLPAIDAVGRGISAFVGLILLSIAIFAFVATANIGLFSTPPSEEKYIGRIIRFTGNAYASDISRITIQQYHPKVVALPSGEEVIVFADNIKALKPSRLVIFRPRGGVRQFSNKITYSSLLEMMGNDHLLFEGPVAQDVLNTFEYKNYRYSIRVDEVLWYLFGSDYLRISITQSN